MNPMEGGRFCDQCQQKVHDLSGKTAQEIEAWIPTQDSLPCVRVKQPVWNTSASRKTLPKWAQTFLVALVMAFGLLAASPKVNGQTTFNVTRQMTGNTLLRVELFNKQYAEPMAFTAVAILQNGILVTGVVTDEDGKGEFRNLNPGVYKLEVRWIEEWFSKEIEIHPGEILTVKAEYEETIFGGDPGFIPRKSLMFDANTVTYDSDFIHEKGR